MTPNSYKREWRGVVQDLSTNNNIRVASTRKKSIVKNFVLEHEEENNSVKKREVVQRGEVNHNVNRRRK